MLLRIASLAVLLTLPLAAQQIPEHAPDGGTRERVESIDIPSIPNAPFTATVLTELTHIMPDGSKRTGWNHRLVARDSAGRVFQERRFFSPKGQTETTPLSQLDFLDPNQHQRIVCSPARTCRLSNFTANLPPAAPVTALQPLTKLANGVTIQRENLGANTIDGVEALGSREITTLPGALIGSDQSQPVIKEFWFSPRLGINLVTKRFDPRISAIQNFTVTQINLAEPDPKLFAPPAGYTIDRMPERRPSLQ